MTPFIPLSTCNPAWVVIKLHDQLPTETVFRLTRTLTASLDRPGRNLIPQTVDGSRSHDGMAGTGPPRETGQLASGTG